MSWTAASGLPMRAICATGVILAVLPGAALAEPPPRATLPGVGQSDRRVVVDPGRPPWRAIGRVQTELGGRCTGFLVGPRTVVTAAHCLFLRRPQHYVQAGSVHFLTGYAFGGYAGHAIATRFTVAPGYDPKNETATAGADWAVLTLGAPLGTPDRILPLAGAPPAGTPVALGGYGQDRAEVIDADLHCVIAAGANDGEGRALLAHTCDATRGTSGAPLLAQSASGAWEVVGIQIEAAYGRAGGVAVPADAIRIGAEPGGAAALPPARAVPAGAR